jgi:hypothetical protein
VHGANGASVGAETDSGATFIAGMTAAAAPPLNDLWTIPGEEALLPAFQEEDRAAFRRIDPGTHYHVAQDRGLSARSSRGPPASVTGADGRKVVEIVARDLSLSETSEGPCAFRWKIPSKPVSI